MGIIAESLAAGDVWMWVVALLGIVGLAGIPAYVWLESSGRRVSPTWVWVVPASIAAVSLGVTAARFGEVAGAAAVVGAAQKSSVLAKGLGMALEITVFGALLNAILCAWIPLGGLIATRTRSPDDLESTGRYGQVILGAVFLAVGYVSYLIVVRETVSSLLLLADILFAAAGIGCALLAWKMPVAEQRDMVAHASSDRWSAAVGIWISTASAAMAATGFVYVSMAEGMGATAPESRIEQLSHWAATVQNTSSAGLYLTTAAFVAAVATVASAGRRALDRDPLLQAVGIALLWLPAALAFFWAYSSVPSLGGSL